jgi:hypothetical protein
MAHHFNMQISNVQSKEWFLKEKTQLAVKYVYL